MISNRRDLPEFPRTRNVSVERGGITYEGTYTVTAGVVSLSSAWGSKTTRISNKKTVSTMARLLLSEVIPSV
jgi:hypothetical protein